MEIWHKYNWYWPIINQNRVWWICRRQSISNRGIIRNHTKSKLSKWFSSQNILFLARSWPRRQAYQSRSGRPRYARTYFLRQKRNYILLLSLTFSSKQIFKFVELNVQISRIAALSKLKIIVIFTDVQWVTLAQFCVSWSKSDLLWYRSKFRAIKNIWKHIKCLP